MVLLVSLLRPLFEYAPPHSPDLPGFWRLFQSLIFSQLDRPVLVPCILFISNTVEFVHASTLLYPVPIFTLPGVLWHREILVKHASGRHSLYTF